MSKDINELLEKRIGQGRVYRDMEMRAADSEDSEQMVVEGYATTFNEAYKLWSEPGYTVMEQVDARAFDEADMSDVIMQYDHEGRVFARLKNKTLALDTDDHGLKIRANLGGTDIGRQLYQEIKGGYTDKMSFAFRVAEDVREITENNETGDITVLRTITRIEKVYDVSAVSIPANDGTSISARSYGEGVIAELKAERLRAEEVKAATAAKIAKIKILTEV